MNRLKFQRWSKTFERRGSHAYSFVSDGPVVRDSGDRQGGVAPTHLGEASMRSLRRSRIRSLGRSKQMQTTATACRILVFRCRLIRSLPTARYAVHSLLSPHTRAARVAACTWHLPFADLCQTEIGPLGRHGPSKKDLEDPEPCHSHESQ